jgi:large subunit ribosomal protein L23
MHIYEVLRRPVVTEKSMISAEVGNRYTFEVDMRANKFQVKEAVELAFSVTVTNVNTVVMPVKTTRRGKRMNIRKGKWKKAMVELAPGNSIQLFEGV